MTAPVVLDTPVEPVRPMTTALAVATVLPASWADERRQLTLTMEDQRNRSSIVNKQLVYQLAQGETLVTIASIDALGDKLVTAADLTQMQSPRGEYRAGDTRRFAQEQEQCCVQYNCWMRRNADGSTRYLSEAPKA